MPVEVVATSLTDGRERWFTYGPVVEAVLASAAIPAIFPPVEIDGERFIDGGVVDNVPDPPGHRVRGDPHRGAAVHPSRSIHPHRPSGRWRPCSTPSSSRSTPDSPGTWPSCHRGSRSSCAAGARSGPVTSTTSPPPQALIAQGREEASEVVRRYGLGLPGPPASIRPVDGPGESVPWTGWAEWTELDALDGPGNAGDPVGQPSTSSPTRLRHPSIGAPTPSPAHPSRRGHVTAHDAGRHAGDHAMVGEVRRAPPLPPPPPRSSQAPSPGG